MYDPIQLPQDANTKGSQCDVNFSSKLALNFELGQVILVFTRDSIETPADQSYYCDG